MRTVSYCQRLARRRQDSRAEPSQLLIGWGRAGKCRPTYGGQAPSAAAGREHAKKADIASKMLRIASNDEIVGRRSELALPRDALSFRRMMCD